MSTQDNDYRQSRREYIAAELNESALADDPIAQFSGWLNAAHTAQEVDATAMTLATVNAQGMPSARIVLLKHFDPQGFAWYTDYRSQKGQDLLHNPQAALLFFWPSLHRQVRIQGRVERLETPQNDAYFHARPRGSQLSAAVSVQTAPVSDRGALAQQVAAWEAKYVNQPIPRPEAWGGYCLCPDQFEFWQGRENRLHDRFQYQKTQGQWQSQRLQP